jgi:hypothetical protein
VEPEAKDFYAALNYSSQRLYVEPIADATTGCSEAWMNLIDVRANYPFSLPSWLKDPVHLFKALRAFVAWSGAELAGEATVEPSAALVETFDGHCGAMVAVFRLDGVEGGNG